MTYEDPKWAVDLVEQLDRWKDGTAIMADLRHGRGKDPVDCVSMHRWVSRFVSEKQVGTGKERAVYMVASQFALHPNISCCDYSLGRSLEQITELVTGVEARLIRLTQSRTNDDLCRRIPGVLSLIDHCGGKLSWSRLAKDINMWDNYSSDITRRWLRDFFNHLYTDRDIVASETN